MTRAPKPPKGWRWVKEDEKLCPDDWSVEPCAWKPKYRAGEWVVGKFPIHYCWIRRLPRRKGKK